MVNLWHDLYKTGDKDAPDVIKDRNGEVVLGLCRKCGRGEIELSEPCEPTRGARFPNSCEAQEWQSQGQGFVNRGDGDKPGDRSYYIPTDMDGK